MVWGYGRSHGSERYHAFESLMNAMKYAAVLEMRLLQSARSLFGGGSWIFRGDIASWH